MCDNQEAQEDELLALASIYDEDELHRAESGREGEIHLCLELPPDFKLIVKAPTCVEYGISFLPYLVLSFVLPTEYPSSSAPVFTLSSKWLTRVQITTLCKRLDDLWEENLGNVVLFTWIQFLKEETLEYLDIHSPLEIQRFSGQSEGESGQTLEAEKSKPHELYPRAVQEVNPHTDMLNQLLDFDEAQKQKVFNGRVFCCGICFSEKLGSNCLLFKECQHVYCKACMKEYFEIQIRDGKVQCLDCPEPECTSIANPSQVKFLVGKDEFVRYDSLLLQSSLDLMADVVYCPRTCCCTPVMVEPDVTMGICPSCRYAFCTLCKRTYHGLSICKTAELVRLVDECEEEDLEKECIDEALTENWLKENCKRCPSCGVQIQKVLGCNKMTCTSCWMFFCWMCSKILNKANPYGHFQDRNSPCYYGVHDEVPVEQQ
ncbi:E3 ubiquitin-protein ligase RNF14-like [Triplophysa dalaica]|uniref:E3 ubiquitin-protein ligase RNF14-like n=1 Tax=Triplophysa dalaica TaxID=1582913 RepID=UPI0024DF5EB0|nr:E3 ubiquitin-protein ligase RNF14-like [Triplophysa dalaica]XP_056587317.1 E3 ubiquitin-protein ligase RNF14-like [Triplophysa dalaica]XP_056587318.1 E3 ubiquitin-protein ligase RNF14-like [Triplophysa dalaica]